VAAVLKAAPAVLKAAAAAEPAVPPAPAKAKVAPRAQQGHADQAEAPHPAKHKPNEVAIKSSTSRHADQTGATKLFVLDTNVLMHDPTSLFRFEEHDVYLPMMTLEELDNHKKGMTEVARNARQVSRTLDALVSNTDDDAIDQGIPLSKLGNKDAKGRLYFQTRMQTADLPLGLPGQGRQPDPVRGAFAGSGAGRAPCGAGVERHQHAHQGARAGPAGRRLLQRPRAGRYRPAVLGHRALPDDFWNKHGKDLESGRRTRTARAPPSTASPVRSRRCWSTSSCSSSRRMAKRRSMARSSRSTARPPCCKPCATSATTRTVWGVTARNREQNFALNLLMNPECDFVTLLGQAGTGKTLLALAAGLAQVLETKLYNEIIVTRVTVPVGEDIGFLPGTEEEKMSPWMGAFDDNLEVLNKSDSDGGEWGRAATQDLIRSRIKIKSLNFMRGRTFVNKFLIIDEAQNLTPKQVKTLVTRAGPTKILCLGNIAQIDTPYLTEGSSGLTYVVDRFKGWSHSGHVTLARGERSRLADHASDVL
jgi:PhoH-like ATPase